MSYISPGVEVDAPTCVPSRFGLFSVAEVEDVDDGHWEAGFWHENPSCATDVQALSVKCPPGIEKDASGELDYPESDPFALVAGYDCSTGGKTLLSRAFDLAGTRLDRGEQRAVERVFWTGLDSLGGNVRQTLGGTDADRPAVNLTPTPTADNPTGAVSITDGLAMLESWAGENMACSPVVHAQRGLGVYMRERQIIEREGNTLYSGGTGTRVAIGGGYLATGPAGLPAPTTGQSWMFVSGSIKILRGPKFFTPDYQNLSQAVDREINDVTVFAERMWGIEMDCGLAAVLVHNKSCCC